MTGMGDHDDEPTPARRGPAYSLEAIDLLDTALTLVGAASELREAARRLDEAEAGDRHQIRVALEFRLTEVGGICLDQAAALRDAG